MQQFSEEVPVEAPQPVAEVMKTRKRSFPAWIAGLYWRWFWELGGVILSVSGMVVILILLPYLESRLVKSWNSLIASSAAISTFKKVAKTSMPLAVVKGLGQLK